MRRMDGPCLIVGAGGLLGGSLQKRLIAHGNPVIVYPRAALDVTDAEAVRAALKQTNAAVLINATAMTDVDGCERDPAQAALINATAPGILAAAAQDIGAVMVHVSTDYVFPGRTEGFYEESDQPDPINVYGKTKLDGERAVAESCTEWLIVRTSGLYGRGGKNFICKMPELFRNAATVRVIDDLNLSPTYVLDLSDTIIKLLDRGNRGLYHVVNEGQPSWYEVARVVARFTGAESKLSRASHREFPLAAKRPVNSSLINGRLLEESVWLRSWKEALHAYLLTCS
jgi:dTDP-4-dehydrorhamnose reductase